MTTTLINMAVPCIIMDALVAPGNGDAFALPIRNKLASYEVTLSDTQTIAGSIETAMHVDGPWTQLDTFTGAHFEEVELGSANFIRAVLATNASDVEVTVSILCKPII